MVKSIIIVQLNTIIDVGVERVRNISPKVILEDGETVKMTKETLLIVTLFSLVAIHLYFIIFNLYYVSLFFR